MLIPRFDLVVHKTTHCIHKSAVIPLHLALTGRPIRDGTRVVDLQKLTKFFEQFTLKVPRLISEDLKMIPIPNEKRIAARCISAVWERRETLNPFGETFHQHEYVLIHRFSAREGALVV